MKKLELTLKNLKDTIKGINKESNMSLENKFELISKSLKDHFESLSLEDKSEELLQKIKLLGGTSEENLKELTSEDLEKMGIPTLLSRKISKMVNPEQAPSNDNLEKQIVIMDNNPVTMAARLKPEELVAEFDPNDPSSPFGVRLKELSDDQKFLVYDDTGSLLVGASARNLREILEGYPSRETIVVEDNLRECYSVGNMPSRYADQHPMFKDQLLYPNGESQRHVPWVQLDLDIRKFVSVARENDEMKLKSKSEERPFFDSLNGKSLQDLFKEYPSIAVIYNELEGSGNLPSLKVPLKKKIVRKLQSDDSGESVRRR